MFWLLGKFYMHMRCISLICCLHPKNFPTEKNVSFFLLKLKNVFPPSQRCFFCSNSKTFFFSIAANCTEDASEDDTLGRFGINRPF
jgi:hypothetical protein